MKALSISGRLWLIILFLTASLLSLWAGSRYFQGRIADDFALRQQLAQVQLLLLEMRTADKDFLQNRELAYNDQFEALYQDFSRQFALLEQQASASQVGGVHLEQVSERFTAYAEAFRKVVALQKTIGLSSEEGLYAGVYQNARQVEVVASEDPAILAALLTLRQHEKDFMLYRNPVYAAAFATGLSDFRGVMFMSDLDNSLKAGVQSALRHYTDSFNELVQAEIDIGLDAQSGLIGEMRDQASEADIQFSRAQTLIAQHTDKDILRADTLLSVWVVLIIASAVSLVLFARYRIVKNLGQAVAHAQNLSEGNWATPIVSTSSDETGTLLRSMETMRRELVSSTDILKQDSLLKSQLGELSQVLQGIKDSYALCDDVIRHVTPRWNALVGAIYLLEENDILKRAASYGISDDKHARTEYQLGESLIGQAAANRRFMLLDKVPAGYLSISSGTGSTTPAAILVAPLVWNNQLYGVMELGSLSGFGASVENFFEQAGELIAVAIHAANTRTKSEMMLADSRRQAEQLEAQRAEAEFSRNAMARQAEQLQESEEQLQAQQEELRVINEELEAQGKLAAERTRYLEQRNRTLEARLKATNA